MMFTIEVNKENPNFQYMITDNEKSTASKDILSRLKDFYCIFDDSVVHTYNYKHGIDDGKRYFITTKRNIFLRGLKKSILSWLDSNGAKYADETEDDIKAYITIEETEKFMNEIGVIFTPFDFQVKMVFYSINLRRIINLAAVGSGKSFVIYCITRWFLQQNKRLTILTPDLMLKTQLYNDFLDYYNTRYDILEVEYQNNYKDDIKFKIKKEMDIIEAGRRRDNIQNFEDVYELISDNETKFSDKPIKVVNWQSVYRLTESEYFNNLDGIIIDEVHKAGSADSYYEILKATGSAEYRIGLTGTNPSNPLTKLTLDGLIGRTVNIISLRQLIDRGLATEIFVQPILLRHPKAISDELFPPGKKKLPWSEESKMIRNLEYRNKFIAEFGVSLSKIGGGQATIILAKNRDTQKQIFEFCKEIHNNVYAINGNVKAKDREKIRQLAGEGGDIVVVGSGVILSTGINIPALTNIIKTDGKSEIELIQSAGRVTRKSGNKNEAMFWDIVDDARYFGPRGGVKENYHYKHYLERVIAYTKYELPIRREISIDLTNSPL